MSVYKRNGEGNYYIQFNFNGKTYIKSSKTTNRKVAEKMERDWKDEIHAIEELGERQRIKLKDALANYLQSKVGSKGHQYTKGNVSIINQKFPSNLYIDELRDWHLTRFKSQREKEGCAAQTIKHNFQTIRNAWTWAKDNGYLVKPLEYPKMKLAKHRLRYLTIEEEKRLLAELDPKREFKYHPKYEDRPEEKNRQRQDNYDLVVLLLDTGARYSEIANITWDRIDLEQRLIHLWRPKVRNESIIYMTGRVYDILSRRRQAADGQYVFTNEQGGPRGYAAKGIFNAFERAGLKDFHIHDLRHTCASRLVQNGMNLYEVSQMLGHVDVQTTQRYAHLENRDIGKRARDIMEKVAG
jgi:integrase